MLSNKNNYQISGEAENQSRGSTVSVQSYRKRGPFTGEGAFESQPYCYTELISKSFLVSFVIEGRLLLGRRVRSGRWLSRALVESQRWKRVSRAICYFIMSFVLIVYSKGSPSRFYSSIFVLYLGIYLLASLIKRSFFSFYVKECINLLKLCCCCFELYNVITYDLD